MCSVSVLWQVVLFQEGHVLDVSRDEMAVITVSQSLNTLGVIEGANSVALSMFGYNKRDMLGKNISLIVPPPMNARHDEYLKAFLDSGRSVVSGPSPVVKHRPVLLCDRSVHVLVLSFND